MAMRRFVLVVVVLASALVFTGCFDLLAFWHSLVYSMPQSTNGVDSPAAGGGATGAGPGSGPATTTDPSDDGGGAAVACYYGERLQCWGSLSNPNAQQVDYHWTVNGAVVNSGQTNASAVATTYEPTAPGEYSVEFSVRYADGTWRYATTAVTIDILASSPDDSGSGGDNACPSGVYILGVCSDGD